MKRSVCAIGQRLRISSQIGKGSLIQRGSRWSKSVLQSLTGGRWLIAPSFLDDLDRELGTVGFGKVGFFLQLGGNRAVIDLMRVAELIELEQFRRDRLAAIVPLAFFPVDANLQCCAIGHTLSFHVRWRDNAEQSGACRREGQEPLRGSAEASLRGAPAR